MLPNCHEPQDIRRIMNQNRQLTATDKDICQVSDCVTIRNILRHVVDCRSIRTHSNSFVNTESYRNHRRCFVAAILSSLYNGRSSTSIDSFSTLQDQMHDIESNAYETATSFQDYFHGLIERVCAVRLDCNKNRSRNVSAPLEASATASDHEDLNELITYQNSFPYQTTSENNFINDLSDEAKPYHPPVSSPCDLCEKLLPVFRAISDEQHSFWVRHSAARKDMSTFLDDVYKKLKQKAYETPIQFIEDMRRIFVKVWIYHLKTTSFYEHQNELQKDFEIGMDPIVKDHGYCCAHDYVFLPRTLVCYKKDCSIPPYASYYVYSHSNASETNVYSDKYIFCEKCFDSVKSDYISIGNNQPKLPVKLPKAVFDRAKNGDHEEAMVDCIVCSRRFHTICVLYHEHIWPEGYVCKQCQSQCPTNSRKTYYFARDLPTNKLSDALETRVNAFLRKECDADTGRVTIRVLSASDRVCEIKPRFKKHFGAQVPDGYPYRTKAIFAFQEIDGVDVVLFGMHVQEYDSRCPGPNAKRVYVSYLDSVHYFRPKQKRTALYYEILIGYLDYVKQLGFVYAHIWACPPSEGDDYIFYCHPLEQRVPKPKRLQEWYKTMLDIAVQQRVVVDYTDIMAHCQKKHIDRMTDVPYFDGDYWTRQMEDLLDKIEYLSLTNDIYTDGTDELEDSIAQYSKKRKRRDDVSATRENSDSIDHQSLLTRKRICSETNSMKELKLQMAKEKEAFFIVRLRRSVADPFIEDPDATIRCSLIESRESFLSFARDGHLQFSSLRRSKYSTVILLIEMMMNSTVENYPRCPKFVQHTKHCLKISNTQCFDCRLYLSRIGNHVNTCTDQNCPLPYCALLRTQLQRSCTVNLEQVKVI